MNGCVNALPSFSIFSDGLLAPEHSKPGINLQLPQACLAHRIAGHSGLSACDYYTWKCVGGSFVLRSFTKMLIFLS